MEGQHILLTYEASPEEKSLSQEVLGSEASLGYLEELSGEQRQAPLRAATVLLAWDFPREISVREYPWLEQVRLIQLLSAGADHMPVADLPPQFSVGP